MAERLRGRRGVEQRKRRLRDHPLCAECEKRGDVTATDEIDHILPLSQGGEDTDDNVQGLCFSCHAIKSAIEQGGGGARHPDWLRPSAIPLTIVCGPPCSGKTTYVEQHAAPGDTVICLDTIMMQINPRYTHWVADLDGELLTSATRARNAMLGQLSRAKSGRAWFIVSAPSEAERDWWFAKLGGEVILLHPGAAECKRRAMKRGTPLAAKGVDAWERKARTHWEPRAPRAMRPTISASGWPVGME